MNIFIQPSTLECSTLRLLRSIADIIAHYWLEMTGQMSNRFMDDLVMFAHLIESHMGQIEDDSSLASFYWDCKYPFSQTDLI